MRDKKKCGVCFPTCLLFPSERDALLRAAHGIDADQVIGVRSEPRQGEVVPGGGQPLILGPAAAHRLVANAVAGDFALGREPVDGEGVGENLGETQIDRRIQSWRRFKEETKCSLWLKKRHLPF